VFEFGAVAIPVIAKRAQRTGEVRGAELKAMRVE
jgi:hypothetical protein